MDNYDVDFAKLIILQELGTGRSYEAEHCSAFARLSGRFPDMRLDDAYLLIRSVCNDFYHLEMGKI